MKTGARLATAHVWLAGMGNALLRKPGAKAAATGLRVETNFLNKFNLIWVVQSPFAKINLFSCTPNHFYNPRRLVPHEGRFAIVTTRGMRCGGRGQRRACDARCAGRIALRESIDRHAGRTALAAYGEMVWSWHPTLVSSLAEVFVRPNRARTTPVIARRRWQKKLDHRGERL